MMISNIKIGIISILLLGGIITSYIELDKYNDKKEALLKTQESVEAVKIENDKKVIVAVNSKLQESIKIKNNKKIQVAKDVKAARDEKDKILQNHPEEQKELDQVATTYETAIQSEEEAGKATEAALEVSQEKDQAQDQVIQDQDKASESLKNDLENTTKEVKTETNRKKLWRDTALISTSILLLKIILHF